MNAHTTYCTLRAKARRLFLVGTIVAVGTLTPALANAAEAAKAAPKTFPTADAAFQALADAAKSGDAKMLVALLGPGAKAVVDSGDKVADKQNAENFSNAYATKHAVQMDGDAKATLTVGSDDWPLPIPAVKGAGGWMLDGESGKRELLARRIGENELNAIEVVRAIVDAQFDYSSEDRDKDGLRDYAAKFISTKGKKDGLYWPTKEGEPASPLGPIVGKAAAQGYKGESGKPAPYHGYYYRILTAQGKDAPGGARNYVVRGRMLGGFAVVAYPATFGNSGIMTFIVNQDGKVYQKDLGASTAATAQAMKAYNPDNSWTEVK
jgi:hypothetical protein